MLGNSNFQTGIVSLLIAIFLFFIGIPYGVTSPSNISNIFLSPTFWPEILSVVLAITGISLLFFTKTAAQPRPVRRTAPRGGYQRMLMLTILIVLYIAAIPRVGLVWSSIVAFLALSILIHSTNRIAAAVTAIFVPILLYAFFAHVAGISIPQGEFVRLP